MTKQELLKSKSRMFGERENLDEAMKYALSMFHEKDHMALIIALGVYHNTLIQMVVKDLEDESVPLGGLDVKDPSKCRLERKGECGCAFGQCENGLVY